MSALDPSVATPSAVVREPRGPSPSIVVARELARAAGGLGLLPVRAAGYLLARDALRAELANDLSHPATIESPAELGPMPARPLRIFVSAAEASGEVHARELVRAIRTRCAARGAPTPAFVGLGGARLSEEGVELLGRPVDRASMGLSDPLRNIGFYVDLLKRAGAHMRDARADVCLPVDSPALHVPLARIAHAYDVPVAHYVTPQYWGWAPWRVSAYRSAVDLALTILPFEPPWFARHGVRTAHVGHPLLDALVDVPDTAAGESARELVLLCGSRRSVIERNLAWMLDVAARLRASVGDVPVVVAHEDRELESTLAAQIDRAGAREFARVETGDLHATLSRARAAFSVSGTVLIDLLHHRLPSVVIYRLENARTEWMSRHLLTVPWFSSVNLLAAREVYPEFCFHGAGPVEAVTAALARCYGDADWRATCRAGLELARARLGPAGAADRAASQALALALRGRSH
jgi:lipid-A-disaccharide synthase